MGPSGVRPVLPGVSLTQTSCKLSIKSTMGIADFQQSPSQRHAVPQQPLLSAPFPTAVKFASASHHKTQSFQSYTARPTGTQLRPQQRLPMPTLPSVMELEHLPYQQVYSPFPGPAEIIPQQQIVGSCLAQQTAATPRLTHYPPPAVKPVKPDFYQLPATDSIHLADQFPFSYSIAKELPHIFGNLEDDQVLDRPLTPSFEPPTEPEPWWETTAIQSDLYHSSPANLTKEDSIDNASPSCRHAEPSNFNSCCFGSTQVLSPQPLTGLSSGLISRGRRFSFQRQN